VGKQARNFWGMMCHYDDDDDDDDVFFFQISFTFAKKIDNGKFGAKDS
jgi:hypothetical protein